MFTQPIRLTGGNQSEGIQALMNGDPVQISMHSNLIYSAFDPAFQRGIAAVSV